MIAALLLAASVAAEPCIPVTASWSPMDAANHLQAEFRLESYMPWRNVTAPTSACYSITANPGLGKLRITRVRTFFATDRGNVCEAELKVVVQDNQLAIRSEHKEEPGIYDAWREGEANRVISAPTVIEFRVLGYPTTPGGSVTIHFGVILDMTWEPPLGSP